MITLMSFLCDKKTSFIPHNNDSTVTVIIASQPTTTTTTVGWAEKRYCCKALVVL